MGFHLRRAAITAFIGVLSVAIPGMAQPVGFVDSRQLLLAHPIFRTLNPAQQRFAGTTAPSRDLTAERAGLASEAQAIAQRLSAASATFRLQFSRAKNADERKRAEDSYWTTRRSLETRRQEIEERGQVLARALPSPDGGAVPMSDTLISPIREIQTDIEEVIQRLATRRKLLAVLDLAAAPPPLPTVPETSILHTTSSPQVFSPSPDAETVRRLEPWLSQARGYWHQRLPSRCGMPFKYGFIDLRGESIRELIEIRRTRRTAP